MSNAEQRPETAFARVMWDRGVVTMPDGRHTEMLIQSNLFHGKLRQLPLTNMQTLQFGLSPSERWHLCNLTVSGGGISCQPVDTRYRSQKKFVPTLVAPPRPNKCPLVSSGGWTDWRKTSPCTAGTIPCFTVGTSPLLALTICLPAQRCWANTSHKNLAGGHVQLVGLPRGLLGVRTVLRPT